MRAPTVGPYVDSAASSSSSAALVQVKEEPKNPPKKFTKTMADHDGVVDLDSD